MVDETGREKDILVMLFVIQLSLLVEILEGDRLVPLFLVALLVFAFVVLKEIARRIAESRSSERSVGRS